MRHTDVAIALHAAGFLQACPRCGGFFLAEEIEEVCNECRQADLQAFDDEIGSMSAIEKADWEVFFEETFHGTLARRG